MSGLEILPAPEIDKATEHQSKWDTERNAFQRLLPMLLPSYRDQYVAVHEGRVVDFGPDQIQVALRVYKQFGYLPIYVGLVSEQSPPVLRLPTRLLEEGHRHASVSL